MSRHTGKLRGYTLVETLVVLCIIAGMIALLLPAIGGGQEMARRAQCANNLKQLGLAMHNHHSTHDVFPPGVVNFSGPIRNEPLGAHFSWVVQLLPYMEQYRFTVDVGDGLGIYAPSYRTMRVNQITSLRCPSDPGPLKRNDGTAENNYVGCHHDVESPIDADNHGVLYLNSRVRYEDIADGLSGTLMVGEKLRNGFDLGWASGTRATLRNTGSPINAGDLLYAKTKIRSWSDGTKILDSNKLPDSMNHFLVGGFESRHPRGANFTFCDGSVRFLSDSINRRIYQCLSHRDDGELIDVSKP
ncbi:DUF1559 family PulG-like putative transporter [Singulisphaera acidiphila]|uniref:Type II secretory pathway, pseudopilin PulG n=1 Tax=Singulisphaera acidiphila (strain ATCC BAA-1392 / DSM 18658 / VKM B-2454 / MOB10) TaxID=886293 RepID=L0DNR4_SINAD|nr:DUF1559 domain-containing protein [Singulisphaera acidiphila]AGA30455.1 type II secretory pathway, pseudopilin PulG [Singulisphaera acidiphila DSM 18658]